MKCTFSASCLWFFLFGPRNVLSIKVLSMKCPLSIYFPVYNIAWLLNYLSLKCRVLEMSCPRNVLSMQCPFHKMSTLLTFLPIKLPDNWISSPWNVLFIKCPDYEMSWLWNVLFKKCLVYEMFFFYKIFCQYNFLFMKCPVHEMSCTDVWSGYNHFFNVWKTTLNVNLIFHKLIKKYLRIRKDSFDILIKFELLLKSQNVSDSFCLICYLEKLKRG